MSEKIDTIANKVIEISFYALFFITPLLWNPVNSELFELPKMFFVWMLSIIIAGAWAIRCITSGCVIFRRTPLDIPLLIFLVSQYLSILVSIDKHTSLWGYYTRFNGGILSLTSYALLYWAFVSNMNSKTARFSILYSLFSALLVSLYAIPSHFGYDPTCFVLGRGLNADCWSSQFVPTERIFGTLGQPNWLAAYLVTITPLAFAIALNFKHQSLNSKQYQNSKIFKFKNLNLFRIWNLGFGILLAAVFLLAIFYTRSQSGFIGLGVAAAVFALGYLVVTRKWHLNKLKLVASGGLLLIVLAIFIPRIPPVDRCLQILTTNYQLPTTDVTSSSDIRCIVWKGAIDIWKHYPISGSGPETFAFTYFNFKPPEHNLTSEWDHLYNKAHNEYLNYLSNTGLLGLLAYLIFISSFLLWSFRIITNAKFQRNTNSQLDIRHLKLVLIGIISGYVSILVTNFFGFSVVPVQLLFFLFPAIAQTLERRDTRDEIRDKISTRQLISIISTVFLISYLLSLISRNFLADINYAKAEKLNNAGQYLEALTHIRQAIEKNPNEPVYQDELADIASSLAFLTVGQDTTVSAQLASFAENASDKALSISPRSINFLKSRSNIFITLAQIDLPAQAGPGYFTKAKDALETAQELAPTDARIAYNLGLLYFQNGELSPGPEGPLAWREKAKEQFEKALSLRPNYEDARLALEEMVKMMNKGKER